MGDSKVVLLMATYNGEQFLASQLDSIVAQTHTNWELWVSDDASEDKTWNILKEYQERLGGDKVHMQSGPGKGFAANFLSLITNPRAKGSFYAYSDQDDFWEPYKLQRAIDWLATIPSDRPALYCSRTRLIDEKGLDIGYSQLFKKEPGFLNALVQNIAGGNTMVFNQAALELLRKSGENLSIVAHDWWTYLLVSGADGALLYEPNPSVRYRQHNHNVMGSNLGWQARFMRIFMMLKGRSKNWNDLNIQALMSVESVLTEKNRQVVQKFKSIKNSPLLFRVIHTKKLGIYRQTLLGNIGLVVATLLKKM
ncbi:MAG: glycosyltransferase family 2 protein [Legionellales bacterium]